MGRPATPFDATVYHDDEGRLATPNPVQRWALTALRARELDELFVFGGFGSGKTQVAAWALRDATAWALSEWSGKKSGRAHLLLVGSDGKQLRTVLWPTFTTAFNAATGHDGPFWSPRIKRRNPVVRSYSREDSLYEMDWCTITLASGWNGAQAAEGRKFLVIVGDEGPLWLPEAHERVRARYRQIGFSFRFLAHFATPQPGRSLPLIKERYADCPPYQVMHDIDPETGGSYGRARIMMPTRLNLDHLPPGYIQQLQSGTSPQMARAILDGELVIMEGRIYPTYDDGSLIDYDFDPSRSVVCGYDPGFHRPYLVALQQIEADSTRWVAFDEIAVADMTRDGFAEILTSKPWIGAVRRIITDPAGEQVTTAGESDRAHLQRWLASRGYEPRFEHATHPEDRNIAYGCERGRAWLRAYDGTRSVYVARRLASASYGAGSDGHPIAGLHKSLSEQAIKPGTDEPDRGRGQDHLSHPSDAFRYVAVRLHGQPRTSEQAWLQATEEAAQQRHADRAAVMRHRRSGAL